MVWPASSSVDEGVARRAVSVPGAGCGGGAGGVGAACGGRVPGGRVIAARSGFSISIVAPHFAHRVLALGRSPSLDSSNLYRAWQAGQTMIIRPLLSSPTRSEEHTSELQSHHDLVCRL